MWDYLPHISTVLDVLLVVLFVPWILMTKRNPTAAVAWCLVVLFLPFFGAFLFWVFGYTHVNRPLKRCVASARLTEPCIRRANRKRPAAKRTKSPTWCNLGEIACKVDAFPVSPGNAVTLYHDTTAAFDALLTAIKQAEHHIHMEFYILRNDATAARLIGQLAEKARAGVEVRLLYDAMGCVHLRWRTLRPLVRAGGQATAFLPLNPLRSRIQVNLRNHRKLVVIDGRIAFTGGMNIGDEYLGLCPAFGYWRDSFLQLDGPAVAGLAAHLHRRLGFRRGRGAQRRRLFPAACPTPAQAVVQVIESGPDQDVKAIREIYFAAISQRPRAVVDRQSVLCARFGTARCAAAGALSRRRSASSDSAARRSFAGRLCRTLLLSGFDGHRRGH